MNPPTPSPDLTQQARLLAEQAAEEHGVPIDRICIRAEARTGQLDVIVLDDAAEEEVPEWQRNLISAVWAALDATEGDNAPVRDQFENAVGAWSP